MTAAVTQREILPNPTGEGSITDSPSVSTRARARIPVTVSNTKGKSAVVSTAAAAVRTGVRGWWLWTARPLSLRGMWRLSAVDPVRVPTGSGLWTVAWRLSNWTDRLVMFVLVVAAPTVLTGPLRWLLARPARRWSFYLLAVTAVAAFTVLAAVGQRTGKG